MKFVLCLILIFYSLDLLSNNNVYVLNYSYHSGFLIEVNEKTKTQIPALSHFDSYKYVDIGWGDSEFYRSQESFDPILAFRAAFFPTNSTVRIEGINLPISTLKNTYNYLILFNLNDSNYNILLNHINSSIIYDEQMNAKAIEKRENGRITFFASPMTYHILYTCNTWIASGLVKSGCKGRAFGVIHSNFLYRRFADCGIVIKQLN